MRVIAIVGPTASGKSALALEVAERIGGEIVSADSRQVYRGMDIATAKPMPQERRRVPHHMIDVADASDRYDAARYQREASAVLGDLGRRGVAAIVVGGTGLYVRALLDGLDLAATPHDPEVREALEREAERSGPAALHARLVRIDPAAAAKADPRNVRRVIRYLEIATLVGPAAARRRTREPVPARKVGLRPPREVIAERIAARVRGMVARGVLEETAGLLARGIDLTLPSMSGHGYPHWVRHLRGEIDLGAAVALTVRDTKAYSRRQMTWFGRDGDVRWVDPEAGDPLAVALEVA